jgi:hypothetical protein
MEQKTESNMKLNLITSIVIILILVSCNTNDKIDIHDTRLDKIVEATDSTLKPNPSLISNIIIENIEENWNTLSQTSYMPSKELDNNGLMNYVSYKDTTSNPIIYFRMATYSNSYSAIKAFRDYINFVACCIPDKEIAKLKNFRKVNPFKNSASKIIHVDNIVLTMDIGDEINDNSEFRDLVVSYFDNYEYKMLEIGTGGPAIWTKK